MSFLFYASAGPGIGHLSRLLGIAGAVRDIAPGIVSVFVTEANDARLIEDCGFPYYQLPAAHTLSSRAWKQIASAAQLARHKMLEAILDQHQPEVVVHDTNIHLKLHQLASQAKCQQVLIQRERKDLRTYLRQYGPVISQFSLVAFPHYREEMKEIEAVHFRDNRVLFCGPLLRRTRSDLNLELVRTSYSIQPHEFTIVVSNAGGNAAPAPSDEFLEVVLDAVRSVEEEVPRLRVIVVSGPLSRQRIPWLDLKQGKFILREYELYLFDLFAVSNLVIARGGYNTILELKELGVPALCRNAQRGLENQAERIRHAGTACPSIQLLPLQRQAIAAAVVRIASQPQWSYQSSEMPDLIRENKHLLASRLIEVAFQKHQMYQETINDRL